MTLCFPCFCILCFYLSDKYSLSCCRMFSMWRYLLSYLWLCCLVIGEATNWHDETGSKNMVRYTSISFIAFSLVVVLIESGFSREWDCLKNLSQDKTALEYIWEHRLLPPKIEMNVECYHFERVMDADGVGDHEERVNSFVDTEELFMVPGMMYRKATFY